MYSNDKRIVRIFIKCIIDCIMEVLQMNVLIAEDDEAIANLLYMDLGDEGYCCSIASDGKIVADKFRRKW